MNIDILDILSTASSHRAVDTQNGCDYSCIRAIDTLTSINTPLCITVTIICILTSQSNNNKIENNGNKRQVEKCNRRADIAFHWLECQSIAITNAVHKVASVCPLML